MAADLAQIENQIDMKAPLWSILACALAIGACACAHAGGNDRDNGFVASIKDCPQCPELVIVPAGKFLMGSEVNEIGHYRDESPVHVVTIAQPFAVGRFEVTFAQWDACVAVSACDAVNDDGWGRDRRPVINVSYRQAIAYTEWLTTRTGKHYRLLSEAEWEYAARANAIGSNYAGSACANANVYDNVGHARFAFNRPHFDCDDGFAASAPVGSFAPNAFGLYDMLGNAWEWVEDCFNGNYQGAPQDGSAWHAGNCELRVLRGGGWDSGPLRARFAQRFHNGKLERNDGLGFRVARDLP
jgi:formylglycine-generating enzyme required for sulfatase activity